MKYLLYLLILFYSGAYAEIQAKNDCMEAAKTQIELNECAAKELKAATDEMDLVFQQVLSKYDDDLLFAEKLKLSQDAWIKYRDAQLEMQFPHSTQPHYYGSIYPLCVQLELAKFTRERIKFLNRWLNGSEEGDVCQGSIKLRSVLN